MSIRPNAGVRALTGILYSVYAVLGVCSTRCVLYSVYGLLSVCCTRCSLVLGVNSESWHGEIERDDLTVFCNDGRSCVRERERWVMKFRTM
jgi:hypothetical protein